MEPEAGGVADIEMLRFPEPYWGRMVKQGQEWEQEKEWEREQEQEQEQEQTQNQEQ